MLSSIIAQKLSILFYNSRPENDLSIATPFFDFSSRKHLLVQHLKHPADRKIDQKVIKIRKSFDAANSLPLRTLWQRNFQRSRITGYGFLERAGSCTDSCVTRSGEETKSGESLLRRFVSSRDSYSLLAVFASALYGNYSPLL